MRNRLAIVLCLSVLLCVLAGCGASDPASEPEQEPAEEAVIESGITVTGTIIEAAGKSVDLGEKNEYIKSIASCRWLEKTKVAAQCRISGTKSQAYYFVVYDMVRDMYVYEQYGKQFIWQNDDMDTLIYVLDYAGEGEPSLVCNKNDMVLYESSAEEQIYNVAFVPKGIKVELADLWGNHQRQVLVEAAT